MATTARPFNITAPTTAREAQALATVLAEQESALAKAQREARNNAMFTAAEQILAVDAVAASDDRDKAAAAWQSAAADPSASLEELLAAFIAMRSASAKRAAIVAQASGVMGSVKPLRNEHSGQPQAHRNDVQDYLQTAIFADAIEVAINSRVGAQAGQARTETQARCTDAGEQAAARVK
jgi:hypothetical protein